MSQSIKRYDGITALKAISCLMVFLSHWNGAFGNWGLALLDWLFRQSPLKIMTFGNMAVCIFLMLSGTLISLKVYRGAPGQWGRDMLKRYFRLVIPIFGTHLLVYVLSLTGLFRTGQAASLMGNDWLATYYGTPVSLWTVARCTFITSIFTGDSSLYGPLWMMNYVFFGTVFSWLFAEVTAAMTLKGRTVFLLLVFGGFLVLDSYYVCFFLGNLLAQLLIWLKKSKEKALMTGGLVFVRLLSAASMALFFGGIWLALQSFVITYRLVDRGVGGALGNASFWGLLAGFFLCWGFLFLWELQLTGKEGNRPAVTAAFLMKPLIWLGERCYAVFLVHWLVICTFSCGFYCHFINRQNWFYLGINFFLTLALIVITSEIFYVLTEKLAYTYFWKKFQQLFYKPCADDVEMNRKLLQ